MYLYRHKITHMSDAYTHPYISSVIKIKPNKHYKRRKKNPEIAKYSAKKIEFALLLIFFQPTLP